MKRLLRHQRFSGVVELGDGAQEPLTQFHLQLGLDRLWIGAGDDASDEVEPIRVGEIEERRRAIEKSLRFQGKPERGRVFQSIAVEGRGRDAHYGKGLAVESERGSDDRRVEPVLPLPGTVAHDGNGFRASPVVVCVEYPPDVSADAEHREVVPGYVLGSLRLRGLIPPDPAHAGETATGLKRRELAEPLRPVAEGYVFVVGKKRPIVLQTAVDTAVFVVAQPIELLGPGYRQGLQQNCVHESEDGGCCTDSEGERQDGRRRVAGSVDELAHRVAQVFFESHGTPISRTKRRLSCSAIFQTFFRRCGRADRCQGIACGRWCSR